MFQVKRLYYAGLPAILAFAFTLFSALATASAHSQSVCSVPGDHATIQAALDDAMIAEVRRYHGTVTGFGCALSLNWEVYDAMSGLWL